MIVSKCLAPNILLLLYHEESNTDKNCRLVLSKHVKLLNRLEPPKNSSLKPTSYKEQKTLKISNLLVEKLNVTTRSIEIKSLLNEILVSCSIA